MMLGKSIALMVVAGGTSLLAACGGGGSSAAPATVTAPAVQPVVAEGAYSGTFSNGGEHFTLVLDDHQMYSIYGTSTAGVFGLNGFLQATIQTSGATLTSSDVKDATNTGQLITGSLSATYSAGVSLNGTLTEGSSTVTFTSAPLVATVYDYKQAARIDDIVGQWDLTSLNNYPVSLTIGAAGELMGTSGGCSLQGSIKPRASGKHVFDTTVTFGPAPCVLPGQTLSGIAIDYRLNNGKRQLLIAGLSADRKSSGAFVGMR